MTENATVLKSTHESLGARMVPFAGWTMPVQYAGILDECRAVREAAGLFDVCHMGRVEVGGRDALAFLQRLQTNDVGKLPPGRVRYGLILDEQGRTQDDLLVYREPTGGGYLLAVNASNHHRDVAIMRRLAAEFGEITITDVSDQVGMLALQGPAATDVLRQITSIDLDGIKFFGWARGEVCGEPGAVSRTGYTGEDGFEIFVAAAATVAVWQALLTAGERHGLRPCGLGARDILRLEAGMALYGHEIDETTTPLDANLDWAVKFDHDFVGRPALERIRDNGGPERTLIGLTTDSRRVPREGYTVWREDREIGRICSGGMSPTLSMNIATAYVGVEHAAAGAELEFAVRDKREPARVATLPFYQRRN